MRAQQHWKNLIRKGFAKCARVGGTSQTRHVNIKNKLANVDDDDDNNDYNDDKRNGFGVSICAYVRNAFVDLLSINGAVGMKGVRMMISRIGYNLICLCLSNV